jgi:hypothetical protein
MSTIAASTVATRRPATVTAAAVLLALLGALALILTPAFLDQAGTAFTAIAVAIAALRLVAAVGVWRCRRWAAILGFVVSLLDTLLAAPGLFFAPDATSRVLAVSGVVLGVATLVLLALPGSRRAYV